MKLLTIIATMAVVLAAPAFADGPGNPWPDPVVMAPPSVSGDWTGPYIGIMAGQSNITRSWSEIHEETITTETEVPVYGTCIDIGGHSGGDKCQGDHDDIDLTFGPDLGGAGNWSQTGFFDADKVFLHGETVTIVDAEGNVLSAGTTVGEYASGTLYRLDTGETETVYSEEVVETLVAMTAKASEGAFGAFAGYRKDWGRIVGGVEIGKLGDLTTAEAHIGFDAGKVLIYGLAGAGEYDGESGSLYGVGADVKVGKRLMVGVKYTGGEFGDRDVETATARIAIQF